MKYQTIKMGAIQGSDASNYFEIFSFQTTIDPTGKTSRKSKCSIKLVMLSVQMTDKL